MKKKLSLATWMSKKYEMTSLYTQEIPNITTAVVNLILGKSDIFLWEQQQAHKQNKALGRTKWVARFSPGGLILIHAIGHTRVFSGTEICSQSSGKWRTEYNYDERQQAMEFQDCQQLHWCPCDVSSPMNYVFQIFPSACYTAWCCH